MDSIGGRNILMLEVLMGRPAGWMQELTGRSPMKSPGAPAHRREVEREFWRVIATGVTSEQAAAAVEVSQAVGSRWFRHGGGMAPMDLAPLSGLCFAEREEIAILRAQGVGVRSTALTTRAFPVDDLSRVAPQCSDPRRQARVSGVCRSVEGGPGRPTSEDSQACGQ